MNFFKKNKLYLLSLISGVLFVLGHPTKDYIVFVPFTFIAIGIFLYGLTKLLEENFSFKKGLIYISFFNLSYTVVGYNWLGHTLSTFGGISSPWNYILGVLFFLIIAPQWYLIISSLKLIDKSEQLKTFFYNHKSINLAFLIAFFEAFTPQQFPVHFGHIFMQFSPYIGLGPIISTAGISFIIIFLTLEILSFKKNRKVQVLPIIFSFALISYNFIFKLEKEPTSDYTKTSVRIVQANIGNHMKLRSESGDMMANQSVYHSYFKLSTEPSKNLLDLIIWPETAYPHALLSKYLVNKKQEIPEIFESITSKTGADIFFGGYDRKKARYHYFENTFNTSFHFTKEDTGLVFKDVYHKRDLIPFGETLPLGPMTRFFSQYINNISYFASGEKYTLFTLKNKAQFISSICYEILFPMKVRKYLNSISNRPHFIINQTNDSWYGDSNEPIQHLYLAKWRAIEFNLPIIRSTNTGITSVIYADGSESERIKYNDTGKLDVVLKTKLQDKTVFQIIGHYIVILIWLVYLFLAFIERKLAPKTKLV